MKNKFGLLAVLVGVVALMVAIFVLGNRATPEPQEVALVGQKFDDQGQKHIADGEQHEAYNSSPPTSGPHYGSPAPWGIKNAEIVDEVLLHNLEHGGIVITYKPDLPADQIEQLKQIATTLPQSKNFNSVKIILAPRAKNDRPVSLLAWTYQEHLDSPDGAKIKEFYLSHLDKGPELVQ